MAFTGSEDHDISLSTASEWTQNYRDANPGEIKGHYFGKDAIIALLGQTDCVGLRIYYALNETDEKELIVVGVKENQDDLYDGNLCERSFKCPPFCGSANPLNSVV
jgi:hypothetical protein